MKVQSSDAVVNDIFQLVAEATSMLDIAEASLPPSDAATSVHAEILQEARLLASASGRFASTADRLILPQQRARALQSALAAVVQVLQQSGAPGNETELRPKLDLLKDELWKWHGVSARIAINDELAQFRANLSERVDHELSIRYQLLEEYRQHLDVIRAESAAISDRLSDFKVLEERINTAVRSTESTFANEQLQRASAFASELEEQDERLKRTVSNWGTEFERRLRATESESEQRLRSLEEEYSSNSKHLQQLTDDALRGAERVRDRAKQVDEAIRATEARINTLHQAAELSSAKRGRETLTRKFRQEADIQRSKADRWRTSALVIAAVTCIGGALLLIFALNDGPTPAGEVVSKALLISVAGGIASYCASQSSAHRRREVVAKWVQLQMESIDDSIEPLDEVKQAEARMLLIKTIYGSAAQADDDSGAWGDTRVLAQIASYLRKNPKSNL